MNINLIIDIISSRLVAFLDTISLYFELTALEANLVFLVALIIVFGPLLSKLFKR